MRCFTSASLEETYSSGPEAVAGKLLGVYRNPLPFSEHLLITSDGIAIRTETQLSFFSYAKIQSPSIVADGQDIAADPGSLKSLANGVLIMTEDKQQITIPVRGGHDQFRDVFEFWRFLSFAIKENNTAPERQICSTPS
jgi:hypothetical protein